MIKTKLKFSLFIIGCTLLISSCSKFHKLLKSSDMNAKYDAAVKYYENKKYFNALQLFDELVTVFRGSKKAEETYYYYAMCYFKTGDYITAAYHFNNFVQTFPGSSHAEECAFLNAYCYYTDSPSPSLDQTSTKDAIQQFQLFVNKFPGSEKVAECNKLIDELRLKLETKAFDNARLYYRMEDYKAAVVAFQNVIKDFPATQYKEQCLFLTLRASFLYAEKSIESKQLDRYKSAVENYYKLVDSFQNTKYLRDADDIFNDAKKEITRLEKKAGATVKS